MISGYFDCWNLHSLTLSLSPAQKPPRSLSSAFGQTQTKKFEIRVVPPLTTCPSTAPNWKLWSRFWHFTSSLILCLDPTPKLVISPTLVSFSRIRKQPPAHRPLLPLSSLPHPSPPLNVSAEALSSSFSNPATFFLDGGLLESGPDPSAPRSFFTTQTHSEPSPSHRRIAGGDVVRPVIDQLVRSPLPGCRTRSMAAVARATGETPRTARRKRSTSTKSSDGIGGR